ncbi:MULTISPECIES: hypothetical protein [Sphingobacterium]|uniref:hypothetical protein n=1 Tax=Sphingobacterium TaxID=28453 RepID=UPI00257F903C|nr:MULTISPECIES: hypothetical protein [Sphingobacterium]
MAKIKHLTVTVKYRVGLGDISLPKKVLDQLNQAADNGHDIEMNDQRYPLAGDWLSDTIQERNCMDWECEIEELK